MCTVPGALLPSERGKAVNRTLRSPWGSQDGAHPPVVAPKPALPLAEAEALWVAPWAGTARPGAASACAAHH